MSRFVLSIVTAIAFSVGMAVAQTNSTPRSQGTQGASPGAEQQQTPNQPGAAQPGTYPQTGTSDQNTASQPEKTEKRLKGCVQSQGGQSTLETRKGKEVALTGQDVSAHNGHEVELKGNWESGGNAGMTQSSSGASGEKTFNVTSVKMISESCTGKSKGTSGMGSSPSGGATSNPSGSSNPNQPQ